jgi:membrane-bound lytic murein transglycosylase B
MKQISILIGLIVIVVSTASLQASDRSPKVKSADIYEDELQVVTNSVPTRPVSGKSLSTPNPSPLALKTANFCDSYSKHPRHDNFLKDLTAALNGKVSKADITEIFDNKAICYSPDVFKMTGTWAMLEREVMQKESLEKGRQFYRENKQFFDSAHRKYGVDPSPILAILRIETDFGDNLGEFPLLQFMYNRYFEIDKKSAISRIAIWLPMALEFNWDIYSGGSHAGAFGLPQFMPIPSSLYYAADGDGDGKINLFSEADAIHSIARYFKEHGWGTKSNSYVVQRYNHSKKYADIVLKYREAIKPTISR